MINLTLESDFELLCSREGCNIDEFTQSFSAPGFFFFFSFEIMLIFLKNPWTAKRLSVGSALRKIMMQSRCKSLAL